MDKNATSEELEEYILKNIPKEFYIGKTKVIIEKYPSIEAIKKVYEYEIERVRKKLDL